MKSLLLAVMLSSTQDSWFGAEVRTRASFGQQAVPLRVTWQAKPAAGNCAITLLSLFNGDRIFSTGQGHWSEIGFEIYGGSSGQPLYDAFQTQYITYENPTDPATKRGRQHAVQHAVGGKIPALWDDRFHEFQIEWRPARDSTAGLIYRIDGVVIREEKGGDLVRLEDQMKIYAGAWMGFYEGPWAWGCSDLTSRPSSARVQVDSFHVEEWREGSWNTRLRQQFDRPDEIDAVFERSNWGFESFAGSYCPANAYWKSDGFLQLELDAICGPNP